ncbi:putative mediator complex subunit Med13, mediator complex, subunit Med13, MID domain of medPIWI [Dioscorea sansibarensis]
MLTNVFRIGEQFRTVSWFQFLPSESDANNLPDKSIKAEQKDAATFLVLSAHLQLQNEGFLSTWTNSFVGPWDPSQGVHNPDEKIKLWLFIPGRLSSISENVQSVVSRLKVVGTGLWVAPGDSDEVAAALSQALKNSLERSLRLLSYMRFGDVFTRCHNFMTNENNLRRAQPAIEFVFAATEEGIYVHAVISAKHVRGLCSDDMERLLKYRSSNSVQEGIPVIVAPNGMRGRLIGCRPSDLVKQVYVSKAKASNGLSVGIPFHAAQSSVCQLRGQSFYAEVSLGCPSSSKDCSLKSVRDQPKVLIQHSEEQHQVSSESVQQKQGCTDKLPVLERTFLYPAETVLLPVMQRAFARSSLKRLWLQNSVGTPLFELWSLWNFSGSSHLEHCLAFGDDGSSDFTDCLGVEFSGMRMQRKNNSSSNSNSSSISSISSTSSESDNDILGANDLEADADSLTCKQSGLASTDQFENDGHKMVSKRMRAGMAETFGQAGTVVSGTMQDPYKSDYSGAEGNNSAAAGVQIGSNWGWDEDGISMDIQTLLSEFGDFGDFFENEVLTFGEPPGTAESQAIMFPSADSGDISGSPCTGGLDAADQKFSPVNISSLDAFTHPFASPTDDVSNRSTESTRDFRSSGIVCHSSAPSSSKFDYLIKAEAMMIFAPEYAAVEIPSGEPSTSIVRNTYLPRSKRVDSLSSGAYFYGATPLSPCKDLVIEKNDMLLKAKPNIAGHDGRLLVPARKLYAYIDHGIRRAEKRPRTHEVPPLKGDVTSPVSVLNSSTPVLTIQKKNGSTLEAGQLLLSLKTTLATEIDCIMFQAAMCRIRHTLLSLSNRAPLWSNKLIRSVMSEMVPVDSSTATNSIPNKYEVKKKDPVPVRIAADVDVLMNDGPVTAPVGVWRSVAAPKGPKSMNTFDYESSPTLLHNSNVESLVSLAQRQPLQELLDAMAFLVQQSTSFVDVSLDTDGGEGPFCCLALQEQQRRGFSCGPSMVHAGCGGLLAVCHSLDIAGVELFDPLSADVQVSSVISLLQSDIKVAVKHAFGNLDGPLSVSEWCKGRSSFGDSGNTGDGYPFQSPVLEAKDSSSTLTLAGEPMSPSQSAGGPSCMKDCSRIDDPSQRRSNQEMANSESEPQKTYCNYRPTLSVLPLPSILVGYQDDWLKTSVSTLQLWDKAPLEPYASPKPVSYLAICPDIDLLTTSATDFFQQLGVVYETCKLGTHSPQISGSQMELSPGKYLPSGLVLVECPQQLKIASNSAFGISSTSDYFHALAKGWDRRSFINSLSKVLRDLKLAAHSTVPQKEGTAGPITVVYVVCPFPEPIAVLQTLVECCAALGSSALSPFKDRRSFLYSQVAKALNCTSAVDEASTSNVIVLSGFSIPRLVLQIVTVESLLQINRPACELAMLKDIAFTVYNKARRIPRVASTNDMLQSTVTGRSQPSMMHVTSPGLWKDFVPRISGPTLTREVELDSTPLRPGPWDSSWQTSRTGGLNCDTNRPIDLLCQEDARYMFEPFLILAEPGSAERSTSSSMFGIVAPESSSLRAGMDDSGGIYMQSSTLGGSSDIGTSSAFDKPEHDRKAASLHCCYGWTEDWRWLVCIWTDSRGELLDSSIFPFGGISSCQDTKVLQCLFVQVLHQGCQILSSSSDAINARPRDIVISRVGCFFELECQEWQKAIYSVGGGEVKKWPLQFRRSAPDGISSSANASSLQQQDMGLIQDRNLPSSPSPSLYSPHAKPSSFMKGGLGQANSKKQLLAGQTPPDSSRGFSHLVQSITLVGVSIDHCLNLIVPADLPSGGGGPQNSSGSSISGYVEGFSPVKSLGSMSASYLLIPSPSMRFLPSSPLQLPTCLTSESPPLAHLLHSKGPAIPLSTGFVVSKAVPAARRDPTESVKEDWPAILSISLVDHYGGSNSNNLVQEKMSRGTNNSNNIKQNRSFGTDVISKDSESDAHSVLESVAAELHSLSWVTASPLYLERRTALPFHCDMFLRLMRLLYYADKELSRLAEQTQ